MTNAIEVESCNVHGSPYCIWFEEGSFHFEDVEAKETLPLSNSHLRWFIKSILELLQGPPNRYFFKNDWDDYGVTRISKFIADSGCYLRCVIWPAMGGRFFIHIHSGVSQQGWKSFPKMLNEFLIKYEYTQWKKQQLPKTKPINQRPTGVEILSVQVQGPSYADKVKLKDQR